MAVIEVSGLTKRFAKGPLAVDHVTFAVEEGSVVGFLGPTTLPSSTAKVTWSTARGPSAKRLVRPLTSITAISVSSRLLTRPPAWRPSGESFHGPQRAFTGPAMSSGWRPDLGRPWR